jgi:hypothetical protein
MVEAYFQEVVASYADSLMEEAIRITIVEEVVDTAFVVEDS